MTDKKDSIYKEMQEYYGKTLQTTDDLKTTANVCSISGLEKCGTLIQKAIDLISPEVKSKYFGCGLCVPSVLENCYILDIGCGAGRDCFCLSKLVGESGMVTGLDMTDEQLEIAIRNIPYHMEKFGYTSINVNFKKGFMENLIGAGIELNSYDVIVSNCVINLSPDKKAVLLETFKVLKEGGELYFSDMYVDREQTEDIKNDKILWGEGIAGALYWKHLIELAREVGYLCPRLVTSSFIHVKNEEIQKKIGSARFVSATYRLFKISKTENKPPTSTLVTYLGGIEDLEDEFKFDALNTFKKSVAVKILDNELITILKNSRFKKYFKFEDCNIHDGNTELNEVVGCVIENPFAYAENALKKSCGNGC